MKKDNKSEIDYNIAMSKFKHLARVYHIKRKDEDEIIDNAIYILYTEKIKYGESLKSVLNKAFKKSVSIYFEKNEKYITVGGFKELAKLEENGKFYFIK